jgi:4-alpha-glucanotransferase
MRRSGILCHISSLPSPYGIGSFGKKAYDFVDFLVKTKQSYWQILPLGPTSYGDSPYQTFSAFANNPYFIDLDFLVEENLIKPSDIKATFHSNRYVDYDLLYQERFEILRIAFNHFDLDNKDYQDFLKKESQWVYDYALFMALKGHHDGDSWLYWDESIRLREKKILDYFKDLLKDDIEFYQFLQFKAYEQWFKLKAYANQNDVEIIGDMPIYVSYDSSDVWANPNMFDLDQDRLPNHVAGVPPDNYSDDGQLWGNPLYDWDYLEKNEFSWWVERVRSSMELFDMIRIDHFIGFVNFFSIEYGEKTAKKGVWKKSPGKKLFQVIQKKLGHVNIIAEDLGVVTDDVRTLVKETGFPGMKLLQFAFDSREENDYIPHLYPRNVIAYTGTHDNQTTASWFETLPTKDLEYCLKYINHQGVGSQVDSLIKTTLGCVADTAIIPIQDYLHLKSEGRMNIPSTLGNNWRWRLLDSEITEDLTNKIKEFTELYGRVYEKEDSLD